MRGSDIEERIMCACYTSLCLMYEANDVEKINAVHEINIRVQSAQFW